MNRAGFQKLTDSYIAKVRARNQFWKSVPTRSLALFCGAIFCLFATIGFLTLLLTTVELTQWQIWLTVLLCGGFAVVYAVTGIRRKYFLFPPLMVAQFAGVTWLSRSYEHSLRLIEPGSKLHTQMHLLGISGLFMLTAGYTFFMLFLSKEGERFFRAHTEIVLARELHQALVPEIQQRIGAFEIYGASIPSGEVGGDLVDLVQRGDEWTTYVADVSGHGVAPGVLMAMFKASVRARMLDGGDAAELLEGVHRALYPIKTSNMFVTAGFLQARGDQLTLSLAGHPALLHFRRQTSEIREYASQNLPVGILPEQSFSASAIECLPGDILLLLTDGITEVEDRSGAELGLDPVKAGLRRWADAPLPELFRNLRQTAMKFGKQQDDQTMLLVRRSTMS
jgi:hypothetical protein